VKSLYTAHEIKNKPQLQQHNLDALDVYYEDTRCDYFDVVGIDEILPYGKTYFIISLKDAANGLQPGSDVLFEFKDTNGDIIHSGVTPLSIDGDGICYVSLEQQHNYTYREAQDGIGSLTVVGELSAAPLQYRGMYNIRYTKHFQIRKNYPNVSDILFKEKPKLELVETVEADNLRFKRSYISLKTSQLSTYGGQVKFAEVSYNAQKSKTDKFQILGTYEVEDSFETLRSPISSGSDYVGNFADFSTLGGYWITSSGIYHHSSQSLYTMSSSVYLSGSDTNIIYKSTHTTQDAEFYDFQYIISGSGTVDVYELLSGSNHPSSSIEQKNKIYSKQYTNFNPSSSLGPIIDGKPHVSNSFFIKDKIEIVKNKAYALKFSASAPGLYVKNVSFKYKPNSGVNPSTFIQKAQLPTVRRNETIDFKVRFLNNKMDVAHDFSKPGKDIVLSGSLFIAGAPLTIETADNLITSSGAFVFGKDVDNGIRMDFKPTGEGNVKGSDTIEFTRVVAGIDNKAIYALSDKGGIINDIETNKVSGSDNSSIIASVESVVSSSTFGSIMASSGSSIKYSPLSVVIGGQNQKIHNPTDNTSDTGNVVIGGGTNIISSSFTTDKVINSIILGGAVNNIRQIDSVQEINSGIIIGGLNNAINTGLFPVILSGNGNLISGSSTNSSIILGGSNNKLIHDNSIIIGKSSFTSTADNTVYINNLDVDGTITANEFHTTYTSASIIYASGSTQFGDTLDDIHNFTGSVNITGSLSVTGDISASANIYAPNIGSGVDNSVVILDSDGTFKTDEVDSRVWGSSLLSGDGGPLIDGYIPYTSDGAGGLLDSSNLYWDSNKLGIGTGAVTPPKTLTVAGDISGSGDLHIQGDITGSNTGSFSYLRTTAYTFPGSDGNDGEVLKTYGAGAVSFGHGERLELQVRNDEGSTLVIGTPVYSKGEIGGSNRIKVGKADASDTTKLPAIGILKQELDTSGNKDGYAISTGVFNENITGYSGLSVNDKLFVAVGGMLTNVKPTGSANEIQNVGIILKTNGTIIQGMKVSAIDRTNDIPNLPTGKIWVGNVNTVTSSIVHLDETSGYLGINTTSPSKTLTVNGDISGSGELNIQGNITASNIAGTLTTSTQDNISQIYNTSLKIGRDSQNLIDFATVDNNIIFRINNADELKLLFNSLQPYTSNGLALGSTSRQWSDLYLYEGGVINWDNGDVTMTQTGNQLDIEGTTLTTFEGDISGSGQVYAVSASFGELSNTTNRWTDGSNGNDEFIAITPGDFTLTDFYSRGDEFPPKTSDSGGSIVPTSATVNYFALKMIPKGFTAIEVYIYSNSADIITVYEGNIANATTTSKGSGNTNATINITDVDGDGTNYLSIKWNPSATTDEIHGGKINIQRTT